jgi:hypothetical protein
LPDPGDLNLQTGQRGGIDDLLNAYDMTANPIMPNEMQLHRRTMSITMDGLTLPHGLDGEPYTCDDLCTRFINEFIEYLPPGVPLLPWKGLPLEPVYHHLENTFLHRSLDKSQKNPLWCTPIPATNVKQYLADFYSYLELSITRLREYGLASPTNSVDALRAECILIMFVALLVFRNADTDPTDSKNETSDFDRILPDLVFRYLRFLGVDNVHSLALSPQLDWNLADALFLRKLWYFWSSIDHTFAIMRCRLPLAVARLPVQLTQADVITHAANIQSAALTILGITETNTNIIESKRHYEINPTLDHPESTLFELWQLGGYDFVAGYASALGLFEVWGQVLDWRLHCRDGNVPLAATPSSPLHPENLRRRYFEGLIGQWRHKDLMAGLWLVGLKMVRGTFMEDFSKLKFAGTGRDSNGKLFRGFDEVFEMETSWVTSTNLGAGIIAALFNLHAWQYVVHPNVDHLMMMKDMNRKRAQGLHVGVSNDHVELVMHSHVHVLSYSILIWSRLLLLHVLGTELRTEHPGKYMDFTFLANTIGIPILRQSTMVNIWLLAELMDLIIEGRKTMEKDATSYEYRFDTDRIQLVRVDHQGNQTILEPDMTDFVNVSNDEFTRDLLSVLGRLHGDCVLDWHRLDHDVDRVMLKSISLFSVMFRVLNVQAELGYHRATFAMQLSAGKLENRQQPIGLQATCQTFMELPLD